MRYLLRTFLRHSYSNRAKRRALSLRLHRVVFMDNLHGLLESQSKGYSSGRCVSYD